jgi:hypothetical protein
MSTKSEHEPLPPITVCFECHKANEMGSKFCGYCGAKAEFVDDRMLFVQCPKCSKLNGRNTPLCEWCDAALPCKFGALKCCSMCGAESETNDFKCSRCEYFFKSVYHCWCGKYARTPPDGPRRCPHGMSADVISPDGKFI